ncbi:hypothetical protein ALNOE001_12550 [Candidatus Methanobinarius endosymbioticus]|uniref:Tetrapyrrole methylase domain-containing protein n=1 Tax=Candidatus Methanobinarius endosymbioticus TaxID=2006182 RepID=A0A366MAD1_9EURY|nr:hypothetical protein ALNOE001_12550 [Candidatus Methanobinarius endosymbioticus]
MAKLFIMGIGPGSKEYLTQIAIKAVKDDDITIGSLKAIEIFDDVKKTIVLNIKDLQEKLELVVDLNIEGNNVSVLSTGDPGFSGVLKTIMKINKNKNFDENNIEVMPGISSLQLAAAKNRISWDEANIMTFHGRENISDILKVINNGLPTIALPSKSVKDMVEFLLNNGVNEKRKVTICYMCFMIIYPDDE